MVGTPVGDRTEFRSLGPTDLPALRSLLERSVPDDYILPMAGPWLKGGHALGAWRAGTLLAVLRLDDLGDGEGWIGGIRVAPGLRRQGLGRSLMDYTHGEAKRRGLTQLRMLIEEENAPSEALARSTGYSMTGKVSHLAGTLTSTAHAPRAELLATEPTGDPRRMRWVEAFGGLFSPMVVERLRLVRATGERLRREARSGNLWGVQGSDTRFVLSPPFSATWTPSRVRSLSPLDGPLEEILDATHALTAGEGVIIDVFLPVEERALQVAEARGLVRGALWGATIGLYERRL